MSLVTNPPAWKGFSPAMEALAKKHNAIMDELWAEEEAKEARKAKQQAWFKETMESKPKPLKTLSNTEQRGVFASIESKINSIMDDFRILTWDAFDKTINDDAAGKTSAPQYQERSDILKKEINDMVKKLQYMIDKQ